METTTEFATATETTTEAITGIKSLVASVWQKGVVELDRRDAESFLTKAEILKKEGIVVSSKKGGTISFSRSNPAVFKPKSRKYVMPAFADEVRCLIRRAMNGGASCNLCMTGAAGTGKTEFVHQLAGEFGVKVYQVNGSEGLTEADFYGFKGVSVDPATKQNYTLFEKGPLYRAFIEGTQVDADGNQVLDENGEPVVIGKPAFFFLDEFAAMLPEVFLGVFNRAMEIPRDGGSRSIEIPMDGGRVVKSHPAMVMFLSGNTAGTGNSGRYQMGFTAQGNKMDESTRNRITAFYRFGYNKSAEASIAASMLNDDREVARLMQFRDTARNMFKEEKVETLFTTRSVVAVCECANNFRASGMTRWMQRAIKVAVFNGLPETDKPAFSEIARCVWGADFIAEENAATDYDYI